MSGRVIILNIPDLQTGKDPEPPDDDWYCECTNHGDIGPHVHCPWGGLGFHIHRVDVETGRCVLDCPHHEGQPTATGWPHRKAP